MRSFSPPGGMAERGFPFFQNSSEEAGCSSEKPEKDRKRRKGKVNKYGDRKETKKKQKPDSLHLRVFSGGTDHSDHIRSRNSSVCLYAQK